MGILGALWLEYGIVEYIMGWHMKGRGFNGHYADRQDISGYIMILGNLIYTIDRNYGITLITIILQAQICAQFSGLPWYPTVGPS